MSRIPTLREWLAAGDFNLALSSSFFGFYAHCGLTTALFEAGFRPKKITGSSAGAIVGGALASDIRPSELREICFALKREDFWDPRPGLGILKGDKFRGILRKHFNKNFSGMPISFAASVFDIFSWRTKFVTDGPLPEVISASCAVPGLFHPVRIGRRLYWDGGVVDQTGIDHEDPARTLCLFIAHDQNKGKKQISRLAAGHQLLRVQNLPRPNPVQLDVGREAYEQGYARAKAALDRPFAGRVSEA